MQKRPTVTVKYIGPDRRSSARRVQPERRGTLRWDPKRQDRRQELDRRRIGELARRGVSRTAASAQRGRLDAALSVSPL